MDAGATFRENPPRVMWLLNHTSARKFEVDAMKRIGIREIFLPKLVPNDHNFRSASPDFSEDANLTIPPDELAILNAQDWYGTPSDEAWTIANRYFDVVFFILHKPEMLRAVCSHFRGAIVWRAYGLDRAMSYSKILSHLHDGDAWRFIKRAGRRFFFGEAYEHLHEVEDRPLADRALFLPLGLHDCRINDEWRGADAQIFFVCPDVGFNPYYREVYQQFRQDFAGLPYRIGGAQPVAVRDPNILGFVTGAEHHRNMREFRAMYYHSTEPNHVHYHPFEAVRVGMPLVFRAGGLLDRLGGRELPGRAKNAADARRKVDRLLKGDAALTKEIRGSQHVLLDAMRVEHGIERWARGFERIMADLATARTIESKVKPARPRVAVILPIGYRGGTLRAAKLVAEAIAAGSAQAGEPADVVFAHVDDPSVYNDEDFADLPKNIPRRPFKWRILPRDAAQRALAYVGNDRTLEFSSYQVAEDGMKQLADCDLWIVISDRLEHPLLPLRPYVTVIYDYLQRYEDLFGQGWHERFLQAAQRAERVLVTTGFTGSDAVQYGGLPSQKLRQVPMLTPEFRIREAPQRDYGGPYFHWPTNAAPHKNHALAMRALRRYYEVYDGTLGCRVTGVNTDQFESSTSPHLQEMRAIRSGSIALRRKVRFMGEVADSTYQDLLRHAEFLWHPARVDNGTFAVVEAARLGVPSLSSDYPAMREMDAEFELSLQWMDPHDADDMARALKRMELEARQLRGGIPAADRWSAHTVERAALPYWTAVRDCL